MPVLVAKDNTAKLMKAVAAMTQREVLVGIPAENNAREDETGEYAGFGNAAIGYIAENGSPSQNIPARPWLAPAIRASKDDIVKRMKAIGQAALAGKTDAIDAGLTAIGIGCVGKAQQGIIAGIPPSLAAATLWRRKHRKIAPRTGETPLIDTANFLQSINFVLWTKKGTTPTISPTAQTQGKESDLTSVAGETGKIEDGAT